jgi:hypothetical protein
MAGRRAAAPKERIAPSHVRPWVSARGVIAGRGKLRMCLRTPHAPGTTPRFVSLGKRACCRTARCPSTRVATSGVYWLESLESVRLGGGADWRACS